MNRDEIKHCRHDVMLDIHIKYVFRKFLGNVNF